MESVNKHADENSLVGKIITFKRCDEIEIEADDGMLAEVEQVTIEDNCFCIDFNLKQFEEFNKTKEKPNFYDKNGRATLKWHDTSYYPKDHRETYYFPLNELDKYLEFASIEDRDTARKMQLENVVEMMNIKHLKILLSETILLVQEFEKSKNSDIKKKLLILITKNLTSGLTVCGK